jgi:hypothetical protein
MKQTSSVQSIMGATEMRRSSFFWEKSSEGPIFSGFGDSVVSAGFVGIPGSLAVAEAT